nr:Tudor-knot domain-containing protein [bacterium]
TVLSTKGGATCIHYDGYGKNWDECVGKERIRGGKASAEATSGAKFAVGDDVKVLWKGSWYDASVTEVNAKKGKYKITYEGYDKSWDEWVGNDRIKAR